MYSLANVLSRSAIKSSSSFVSPNLAVKEQRRFSVHIEELSMTVISRVLAWVVSILTCDIFRDL